jgi:hypothetical protein
MPEMQPNLSGRELQFGRYDLKIEALRGANAYAVNPEGLYRTEFDVARQLDVSAFVLAEFIKPLGLARAEYCGFSLVEPLMHDGALASSLALLAAQLSDGSHSDDSPVMLLKVDAIARQTDHPDDKGVESTTVLLARAKSQLRAGRLEPAYENLSKAIRSSTHLREVNSLLGTYFRRSGNMIAAASAHHASLLNLGPASGLNRPFGLEMDYKGFRILQVGPRFCALPRWRDARVHLIDGRPTVVAHRLPQGLRRWLLRRAPRGLVEWARQHFLRYFLTSKLDRRVIEADDLVAIMRRIDVVG